MYSFLLPIVVKEGLRGFLFYPSSGQYKEIEKYTLGSVISESVILNSSRLYPIAPISLETASHIHNIGAYRLLTENWGIFSGSRDFSPYVKASQEVEADDIYIPQHVLKSTICKYEEDTTRVLQVVDFTNPYYKILQNESIACMVLGLPVDLNETVDGWSLYLSDGSREASKFKEHKTFSFDYRGFILAQFLNLVGRQDLFVGKTDLYGEFGEKRRVIAILNDASMCSKEINPTLMELIAGHKTRILEEFRQFKRVITPLGATIVLGETDQEYKAYSYYLRSCMSFVIKSVLYEIAKLYEQVDRKFRLKSVHWDEILVDISDEIWHDVVVTIENIMKHPVRQYGKDWSFEVRTTEVSE